MDNNGGALLVPKRNASLLPRVQITVNEIHVFEDQTPRLHRHADRRRYMEPPAQPGPNLTIFTVCTILAISPNFGELPSTYVEISSKPNTEDPSHATESPPAESLHPPLSRSHPPP
ncbi:hypothetical protein Bca4012_079549 [Brassica carinata]